MYGPHTLGAAYIDYTAVQCTYIRTGVSTKSAIVKLIINTTYILYSVGTVRIMYVYQMYVYEYILCAIVAQQTVYSLIYIKLLCTILQCASVGEGRKLLNHFSTYDVRFIGSRQ